MNSLTNLFSTATMRKSGSSIRFKNDTTVAIIPSTKSKLSIPNRRQVDITSKNFKKKPAIIKKTKTSLKQTNYAKYIRRVLKQQHPQLTISSKSVIIVDNFIKDMFMKIVSEASHLVKFNKRKTLTDRDINSACKLILTGQLQDLASNEATRAMIRLTNSYKKTNRINDSDNLFKPN